MRSVWSTKRWIVVLTLGAKRRYPSNSSDWFWCSGVHVFNTEHTRQDTRPRAQNRTESNHRKRWAMEKTQLPYYCCLNPAEQHLHVILNVVRSPGTCKLTIFTSSRGPGGLFQRISGSFRTTRLPYTHKMAGQACLVSVSPIAWMPLPSRRVHGFPS